MWVQKVLSECNPFCLTYELCLLSINKYEYYNFCECLFLSLNEAGKICLSIIFSILVHIKFYYGALFKKTFVEKKLLWY